MDKVELRLFNYLFTTSDVSVALKLFSSNIILFAWADKADLSKRLVISASVENKPAPLTEKNKKQAA